MKKSLIVLAGLLFVLRIHAALVEYSYAGKETDIGAGGQKTFTYSGIMIYDTVSSNVTFVDWRKDKTYGVSTDTNLHFTTVTGLKSKTYTVITGSGSGMDTNGFYRLDDYMISGQNYTLTIATNTTFVFPKRFTGSNNRSISPDDNGQEWLRTWGETMTFSASRTKSDNNKNSSSDDVVNALVAALQNKGYSDRYLQATANSFYVNNSGSDANSGQSPSAAWKTLSYGVAHIGAGQTLALASGQTFPVNNIIFTASGTAGHPITITSSGSTPATLLETTSILNLGALTVSNQSYITIQNLRFVGNSNWVSAITGNPDGYYPGLAIVNSAANFSGITVSQCEFLQFDAGIMALNYNTGYGYSGLTIISNSIHDMTSMGIVIGNNDTSLDYTNVTMGFNTISNIYGVTDQNSGMPMLLENCETGIVISNTVHDCGQRTSNSTGGAGGIVVAYADGVEVSHNEAYNIHQQSIAHNDGVGIDLDDACNRCLVQFNYSHDNDGCGYYAYSVGNSNVFRFNVSVNNGLGSDTVQPFEFYYFTGGAKATNLSVYNNTFIALHSGVIGFEIHNPVYGTNIFANNIFVTANADAINIASGTSENIYFCGNDYYQTNGSTPTFNWNGTAYSTWDAFTNGVSGQELGHGQTNNPAFANGFVVAHTDNAYNLTTQTNYVLLSASPILGAGGDLNSQFGFTMPAIDYRGQSLPGSGYSIGACNQAYP